MIREVTVTSRLSEDIRSILEEKAKREGRTMEDVVAEHTLHCRPRRVHVSEEEAERRHQELVAMFGTFDSGDPHSGDNKHIDEDLAREYGSGL
jgi:hypothetical protein